MPLPVRWLAAATLAALALLGVASAGPSQRPAEPPADSLLIVSDGRIHVKFVPDLSNPEAVVRRFLERSFVEYRDAAGNLVSRLQPTFARDSARLVRRSVRVHFESMTPMFPEATISAQAREEFSRRGISNPEAIFNTSRSRSWQTVTIAERDVDLAEIALRLKDLPEVEHSFPANWPPAAVHRLDSRLRLQASEDRFTSPGSVRLRLSTERIYGCTNFGLLNDVQRAPGTITLRVRGVVQPGSCLEEIGPATAKVDLGRLEPGSYRLRMVVGADSAEGRLVVSANAIELSAAGPVIVDRPIVRRIPENLIWGDANDMGTGDRQGVRDFVAALRGAGAAEVRLAEGDYEYFKIDAAGRIVGYPDGAFHMPFVFSYDGAPNALADVVASYRPRIRIDLWTGRGRHLGHGER